MYLLNTVYKTLIHIHIIYVNYLIYLQKSALKDPRINTYLLKKCKLIYQKYN